MKGYCQKLRNTPETSNSALSLPACRLFCSEYAGLWPKPTGAFHIGNTLIHINNNEINMLGVKSDEPLSQLVSVAFNNFKNNVNSLVQRTAKAKNGRSLIVKLNIKDRYMKRPSLDADESYKISIASDATEVQAAIEAETYFGGRHGLETLGQLIIFDDIRNELQIPGNVTIEDKPVYPYRGILLDTARNYISLPVIKRILDGMSLSKLNTFHWHITDSQSFPYVSKSNPNLSKLGAYSPSKIYTPEDVAEVIQFGLERGIRVMPEFDAPAHVGEGWQDTDFVACFNRKPWVDYCVEPPCGQFDPTKPGLYDVLEGKFKEF